MRRRMRMRMRRRRGEEFEEKPCGIILNKAAIMAAGNMIDLQQVQRRIVLHLDQERNVPLI